MARRAFTLIELLTVIAITAILLTIIVLPIFQTFNLLHLAQGYSQAQEQGRILMDRIQSDIENSAGVRDNSGIKGEVAVVVPSGPGSVDASVTELLPYAKLDIIKPAEGEPQFDASGNPVLIDPITGKIDPTLTAAKGQIVLPVAPGSTIIRYWIGLRDPFFNATPPAAGVYNNPYTGLLEKPNGLQDNLYVLYRAEVQPYVYQPAQGGQPAQYVPNTALFALDANNKPILDDPSFFLPDGTAAKAARVQAWMKAGVVQTEFSRFDMIMPVFNKFSKAVTYDRLANGDLAPRLVPLMQFRPSRISNEPAETVSTLRLGEESDNAQLISGDVYQTKMGGWENAVIRTIPQAANPNTAPQALPLLVGRTGVRSDGTTGFSLYAYANSTSDDLTGGLELFDEQQYENTVANGGIYPFTSAIEAANARSGWLTNASVHDSFVPYTLDTNAGKLLASFDISEVGINSLPAGVTQNFPIQTTGQALSPIQDSGSGAAWAGTGYAINQAFNRAWNTYADARPSLTRHIDLRLTPNADGTYGPLFPETYTNISGVNVVAPGNANGFGRATIVPGSEEVYGPDQRPGPNYGNEIRYTRVSQRPVGPNQYLINYVDQNQPANYGILGLTAGDLGSFNPNVYDPTNFVSAFIQPQYMVGYIELNSDPNVPLPAGNFSVDYRFQFTQPRDSVAVDYDSRQAMSILLTIQNYPQVQNLNPRLVTLETTATVRNVLR